ncbi:MAG: class I SAM-dependent RNA methyltransferase [Geminicoccaceae bacterium]|nr:MAG: class I SAM-dependent RNA methyltransferase [Geminicoccaceae bacterium]
MRSRRRSRAAVVEREVVIETLGDQGDGLARVDGRRLVVPGALPGERHRVRFETSGGTTGANRVVAKSLEQRASPARIEPLCPHVPACGGCVTQHLAADAELAWKQERVRLALERRGLTAPVHVGHQSPLQSRRRLRLGVQRRGAELWLGYRGRQSHRVVDVAHCPIARPELIALLPALRRALQAWACRPEELVLTAYAAGPEVVLRGGDGLTLADREAVSAFAKTADLARVAWQPTADVPAELVVERRQPELSWPGLSVVPPVGAFLQATAEAEAYLQATLAGWLEGSGRVLDLFAGIGTLTAAAMSTGARTLAVERDALAVAALRAAGVEAVARDLDRRPFMLPDLARFDAAVLDPPRAGAEVQSRMLAAAHVPLVVYVSCAPTSFARDAQLLVDGGYRLCEVRMVDQFRFAAEVELIGLFDREKAP